MKLPNFVNPSADSLSKIGNDFSYKVVQKLKLSKKKFLQCVPKQVFFKSERFE